MILTDYKVYNALSFKNDNTFWICIAQNVTEWDDEYNPPAESADTQVLTEPISCQRVVLSDIFLVKPVSGATAPTSASEIYFDGDYYTQVDDADAYTENAHHVYMKAILNSDEHPLVEYRQYGLFMNLVPISGYENYYILLAAQVNDYGVFIDYNNTSPHQRELYKRDFIEFIVEF